MASRPDTVAGAIIKEKRDTIDERNKAWSRKGCMSDTSTKGRTGPGSSSLPSRPGMTTSGMPRISLAYIEV